jgi:hypothetical protein
LSICFHRGYPWSKLLFWHFNPSVLFSFYFLIFILFCPSTLGWLGSSLHSLFLFVFYKVIMVSWPGSKIEHVNLSRSNIWSSQYLKTNVIQYIVLSIFVFKYIVQYALYFELMIIIFIRKHVSNTVIYFFTLKKIIWPATQHGTII